MIAAAEPVSGGQAVQSSPEDRRQYLQKTISASRLVLWLTCRLKFYFRYIAQIQKPPTPSMHAGSTVHAILQNWNLARWRRQPFEIERFKLLFESQWVALQAGLKIQWDGEEYNERQTSWFALQHYFMATPVKADEKPEAVEVSVETDLSKHGLPRLVGVIDLVRSGGRIVDFKLVAKTPDPEQVAHTNEAQPVFYSLMYRDATGRKEAGVELHHLVQDQNAEAHCHSVAACVGGAGGPAVSTNRVVPARRGSGGLRSFAELRLCRLRVLQRVPCVARIGTMDAYCQNRLTIVGPPKDLKRFYRDEKWVAAAGARHIDLLEHSPQRHAWQFDTDTPLLAFLRSISREWPDLTFLLDYDCEDERFKGLAKARKGRLRHFRVSY